jgi:hypothetical protein
MDEESYLRIFEASYGKTTCALRECIHDVKQVLILYRDYGYGRCTRAHAIYILPRRFVSRKPFTRHHNCLPNYGTFKNE